MITPCDYLKLTGEIVVKKDEEFDVSCFEIRANSWYSATVRLWPKKENQIKFHAFSERTPVLFVAFC